MIAITLLLSIVFCWVESSRLGYKVLPENYTHNTITYIKGESGRTTGDMQRYVMGIL